jgi:hypothetical protein
LKFDALDNLVHLAPNAYMLSGKHGCEMDDLEFKKFVRQTLESRRKLATALISAYRAGAMEHTAEELADQERELDECDKELAELDYA